MTYYSNHVRGKIHSDSNEKKVYNRIANVENYETYRKKQKITGVIVGIIFFSAPLWVIPMIDFIVKYGSIVKVAIGA